MARPVSQEPRRVLSVRVTDVENAWIDKAALLCGLSRGEWMRRVVHVEAVRLSLAAQHEPARLKPGSVIWALLPGNVYEGMATATGAERCWPVSECEVPNRVSNLLRGMVIDWCWDAKGGARSAIVAVEDIATLGDFGRPPAVALAGKTPKEMTPFAER